MTPDAAGLLTLGVLALTLLLVEARRVVRSGSLSVWFLSRAMRLYTSLRFGSRLHGRAPLPVGTGALVLANHRCPVDPVLLYSASLIKESGLDMRPIEFMTAREYCDLGGPVGWVTRTARSIPVNRDGQDMAPAKEALRRLHRGHLVGIFPEGRINHEAELLPFNRGAAWLALRGDAPVYPAYVHNAPQADGIVQPFLMSQPVDVTFGPAIDLSRWKGQRPTAEVLQEVADHLREALVQARDLLPRIQAAQRAMRRRPRRRRPVSSARGCGCSASGPAAAPSASPCQSRAPAGR
jgi:1-acyl-sn-glycerol-3-phosphate acyltransferase